MADGVQDGEVDAQSEDEGPGHLIAGLLSFQQDCIEELLKNDGLTVIGQGLGLSTVVAALLAVHHETTDSGGAIVMVGEASCNGILKLGRTHCTLWLIAS